MNDVKKDFSLKYGKRESYKCVVEDCNVTIYFSERDEEYYRSRDWVRSDGTVIKPRKCKKHRDEAKGRKFDPLKKSKPINYK